MIETGNDNTNTIKEHQSVSENIDKVENTSKVKKNGVDSAYFHFVFLHYIQQ